MASRGELITLIQKLMNAGTADEARAAGGALAKSIDTFASIPENFIPILESDPTRSGLLPPAAPFRVSELSEQELTALNGLLPWGAPTTDEKGRTLGAPWSLTKRAGVQPLRDRRHDEFEKIYPLDGKSVLEVGCFEGIHTISLASRGADVIAIDSRMENLLKTMVRLWSYNHQAQVELWDLEKAEIPARIPAEWDVLHHIGVLYHLSDPVRHLQTVLGRTRDAVILDTHIALDGNSASQSYHVNGKDFRYQRYGEKPSQPFAGMEDHAKWMLLDDLKDLLSQEGFPNWHLISDRNERNGRRITIWAFRK